MPDRILTWADRHFDVDRVTGERTPLSQEDLAVRTAHEAGAGMPSGKVARGAAPLAVARINTGRWIVDCPFCAGAELWDEETGLFFCFSCRNAAAAGDYLRVQIPDAGVRAMVEEHLTRERPFKARNWNPGETVDDLRRQDAEARLLGLNRNG